MKKAKKFAFEHLKSLGARTDERRLAPRSNNPQKIVNAFGLDVPTIANFFLQFGYDCTENKGTKTHCVHLIMFARSQVLRPRLLPEEEGIDWDKVKKKKPHNDHFKSHYHPISLFTKKVLKNTEKLQIGERIMRMVRKEMRAYSRMNNNKGGTATPDRSTSSVNLTDMRTILEEHKN